MTHRSVITCKEFSVTNMESDVLTNQPFVSEAPEVCFHCGVVCEEDPILHDHKSFCCQGCKVVYTILNEKDLCTYYNIADAKGNTPDKTFYAGKYAYLDLPEVKPKIVTFSESGQTQVNWYIPSMHCASCIWLLEHLYRLNDGVVSAVVNFPEKKVRLVVNDSKISLGELAELMASIGYEPFISMQDIDKPQNNKFDRVRIYKIGISGFAFGNIMFMGLSDYFTINSQTVLGDKTALIFGIVSIVLALPVFFYCASDFFVSAWKAIKKRQLNMDAPIALAILVTFVRSVIEIATLTGSGYLDSMTGIVFFMLVGRYFQDKSYSLLSFDRDYKSYFPIAVTLKKESGEEQQRQVTELVPGDRIVLRNSELIPCDGRLMSESANIDYSFVSGESQPVTKSRNDVIYAGGKLSGAAVEVEVTAKVSQSYLTQLWNNDAFTQKKEEEDSYLASIINKYFTLIVFLIGSVSWGYWMWAGDFKRGFDAMTTVWIVACPCALLLSDTFTNGNLLSLFGRKRFFLKNANVLERLAAINTIVFDKTGTLTLPDAAEVTFSGVKMKPLEKALVLTLVEQSGHPLSKLVRKALKKEVYTSEKELVASAIQNFKDIPGAGIEAVYNDTLIRVGSAAFVGAISENDVQESRVYVAINEQVKGFYRIRSQYREQLAESVAALRKEGVSVYLLSGDKPTDQDILVPIFGGEERLYFQQTPQSKLDFIKKLQTEQQACVMMLGDGLNDAGALMQSEVGVAVSDNVNNFTPACDAIIEGNQLQNLSRYIKLAKAGKQIVVGSFIISVIYNIIGLNYAVRGDLSPVVAAILMPASSISIILFTSLLARWKSYRLF